MVLTRDQNPHACSLLLSNSFSVGTRLFIASGSLVVFADMFCLSSFGDVLLTQTWEELILLLRICHRAAGIPSPYSFSDRVHSLPCPLTHMLAGWFAAVDITAVVTSKFPSLVQMFRTCTSVYSTVQLTSFSRCWTNILNTEYAKFHPSDPTYTQTLFIRIVS